MRISPVDDIMWHNTKSSTGPQGPTWRLTY